MGVTCNQARLIRERKTYECSDVHHRAVGNRLHRLRCMTYVVPVHAWNRASRWSRNLRRSGRNDQRQVMKQDLKFYIVMWLGALVAAVLFYAIAFLVMSL